VTRHGLHGLNHTRAVPIALRPSADLVSVASNTYPMLAFSQYSGAQNLRISTQSGNEAARHAGHAVGQPTPKRG
jgi:hypothetical protein